MKFTDLNLDCLENVLGYLDLINLLNVADSTKRLRKAAVLVFARRNGSKIMVFGWLRMSRERLVNESSKNEYADATILIIDLKTALQLLRCFGCVISKIQSISHKNTIGVQPEIFRELFIYINKYCTEHLNQLELESQGGLLEYFDKPFANLKKFATTDGEYTEKCCLNTIFPNMEQLSCVHNNDGSLYSIYTKHFPHLKELKIKEYGDGEYDPEEMEKMMTNFLRLNPQLKSLSIEQYYTERYNFTVDSIRNMVDSLQILKLSHLCYAPVHPSMTARILYR